MFLTPLASAQPTLGLLQQTDEALPGYTLFSNNQATYLIDNCGLIVQQWTSDYRPGRSLYLLPDGQLLRTAEQDGAFLISGRGGGFERFDWEGELRWFWQLNSEQQQAHHDIAPLPNGNFLCLVWEKLTTAEAQALGREQSGELWSEAVLEIQMLGETDAQIVWEWHLSDHLVQAMNTTLPNFGIPAEYPRKVDINYLAENEPPESNWVHLNAIDYDPELDVILLSSRQFSEVWIIDHAITTAEAQGNAGDLRYRYGNPTAYGTSAPVQLGRQHDAQFLRNSASGILEIMVFNNEETTEQSSVKSWPLPLTPDGLHLASSATEWEAAEPTIHYMEEGFYSPFMSSAQRLPNGHLFICEGNTGRFLEVDATEEIVWEYLNPVNANGEPAAQGATARFNQTFRARKYGVDDAAFAGRKLVGGLPVEINPDESDCFVPPPNVPKETLEVMIFGNVFQANCRLQSNQTLAVPMSCYNAQGQLLFQQVLLPGVQILDFSVYANGIYFLLFTDKDQTQVLKRVVKIRSY